MDEPVRTFAIGDRVVITAVDSPGVGTVVADCGDNSYVVKHDENYPWRMRYGWSVLQLARRWRTWGKRTDDKFGCDECCNGDRCDEPRHYNRTSCPACKGTGALDESVIDWDASTKSPAEYKPAAEST